MANAMRVCKRPDDLVPAKLTPTKSNIVRVWVSSGLAKGAGSKACRKLAASVTAAGTPTGITLRNNHATARSRRGLNAWRTK
ncbi:Uncharacterised protein [Vibrio cholerae]|nr:Uncharacterised protein [Vibrio cholerae]CSI40152.1 Uncharacterised protein [Vibrio cholerae]